MFLGREYYPRLFTAHDYLILRTMHKAPSPLVEMILSNPKVDDIIIKNGFSLVDFSGKRSILSEDLSKLGVVSDDFFSGVAPTKVFPADMVNLNALLGRLQTGASDSGAVEIRYNAKKDKTVWLSLSMNVIDRDEKGGIRLLALHDRDITDLISAQEEIRERLVEIESLKDLLTSINKSLDFNDTIRRIIEHLHRVIPFDSATVQALEGNYLTVIGNYGYTAAATKELKFLVVGRDNPSGRAIASRRPIICNDVEHDFEGFVQVEGDVIVKSWLGIPLVYEGRAIGLFALDSAELGFYTDRHVRIASNVAEHIAMAIEHARQHTIVKEEARTDNLTGIANRYGLETKGQEIFGKAAKEDQPLGILMIDIDHFKIVNDTYGHSYGDQVLKTIAEGILQILRNKDYLVRYGGEEFVILLPDTSTRKAFTVAERLRERIPLLEVDGRNTCPTVSIGVFSGVPGAQDLMHEFIRRADLALYEAKDAGRNRCRVWSPKPDYFDPSRIAP